MKHVITSLFVLALLIPQVQSQDSYAFNAFENLTLTPKNDVPKSADYRQSFEQIKNKLIKKIVYPVEMEMYGIEGTSKVAVTIAPNGKLSNVEIVESLGTAFDIEIREALLDTKIQTNFVEEQTIVFPVLFRVSR